MKSKQQKSGELERGKMLAKESAALLFIDCASVGTKDLVKLRRELKEKGSPLLVMKKRLVGLLLKERGADVDLKRFKTSTGTVFVTNLESAASSVYQFFRGLEKEKKISAKGGSALGGEGLHILGGYDLAASMPIDAAKIIFIGKLPPREVLLAQLLGMIAAPIKSLLYIMKTKSERS